MSVTLKDIANQAGVSVATVSKVLNRRETAVKIRDETREKIFTIAREMGYRPNIMARALRGNRSYLLGVLAQNITSLFHSQIIVGLNDAAVERGYRVFLGHVQRTLDIALDYGSMFEQSHADGVIIIGELAGNQEAFDVLERQHRYIVTISDRLTEHKFPGVYSDTLLGTQLAMNHLWQLGHRRIVCMTDTSLQEGQLRAAAYERYMQEHGAGDLARIIYTSRSFQASFETGQKFFAANKDTLASTAIFAATYSIAIGLLQAAFQSKISIPDQFSVIGFDDIDFAAFTIPPLTTVRQAGVHMGHVGASLLIDMVEQELDRSKVDDIILMPTLIIRQSTGIPAY
jgi:DNA-binding LacI/PurR family transcriptional regulator